MPGKSVSGGAVAMMAIGGVAIWSGLNNVPFLDAVRALAKGQAPTANRKPAFQPLAAGQTDTGTTGLAGGTGTDIVAEAEKWVGKSKYVYGGCHGSKPCAPGDGVDCSSFVSWVMYRTHLWKGGAAMVAGSSMLAWGKRIPWNDRQPGDVALWAGKHCAIITGTATDIEAACTACGPVRHGTYGKTHGGIPTTILRPPDLAAKPAGPPSSNI